MPYVHVEFPRVVYHEDGRSVTVADQAAQDALGPEWMTTPTTLTDGIFSVTASITSRVVTAENPLRQSLKFTNDSTSDAVGKYGLIASASSYTFPLAAGAYWEMPLGKDGTAEWKGPVSMIWDEADGGAVRVTEIEID